MDLKKVTLPLSPEDMVEFFKDKDQYYMVDVAETLTKMNERGMLSYISNLGMKCALNYVSPIIMEEYMRMKNFIEIPMLTAIHANILCFLKFHEVPYPPGLDDFGEEAIMSFIENNQELVIEQCVFLDSFLLYIESRKEGYEIDEKQPTDRDLHDELGFSLLKLMTYEDFMIVFSKRIPPIHEQTYYTKYFDEYMFKGKNLFHYAAASPLFGLVKVIEDGKVK